MSERVQKILSQWGIASRRQAEKIILAGRVRLNGRVVQLGERADLTVDKLEVDGQPLLSSQRPQFIYLLINKPAGVVSTCYDPQKRPIVLDLLPAKLRVRQGIHPVGRLDAESTGALLLTNDGKLTLSLTHPRYHLPKTYRVWVNGHPTSSELECWRRGVMLSGKKTLPARVKAIERSKEHTLLEIVLTEGRNRQIRRVAEQLGYQVTKLERIAIGSISLQSPNGQKLPSGHYRHLEESEVKFLKNRFDLKPFNLAAPT
jgi:23S rRNA pseudouridine2605 synthase